LDVIWKNVSNRCHLILMNAFIQFNHKIVIVLFTWILHNYFPLHMFLNSEATKCDIINIRMWLRIISISIFNYFLLGSIHINTRNKNLVTEMWRKESQWPKALLSIKVFNLSPFFFFPTNQLSPIPCFFFSISSSCSSTLRCLTGLSMSKCNHFLSPFFFFDFQHLLLFQQFFILDS
jgi:hypothetical protein